MSEQYRYFEMPIVGLFGFPAFAIEVWVMFQTTVFVMRKLQFWRLEPLPDESNLF